MHAEKPEDLIHRTAASDAPQGGQAAAEIALPSKNERKKRQERNRRNALFLRQGGQCFYCGCQMLHWLQVTGDPNEPGKVTPDNAATVDHVYPRNHPMRRRQPIPTENKWVIACYSCNQERGKITDRLARRGNLTATRGLVGAPG